MTGRAKWDAWSAAWKTYDCRSGAAEERYLDIAKSLGWVQGWSLAIPKNPREKNGKEDEVDVWDDDNSGSSSGRSGGGLGNSVSAIPPPLLEESDTSTMHGLTIAGEADGLISYLRDHPEADVDDRDEFVRN
jgi:hypothetical protein